MKLKNKLLVALISSVLTIATPSFANEVNNVEPLHSQSEKKTYFELESQSLQMGTFVSVKVYGNSEDEVKRFSEISREVITDFDDMFTVHRDSPLKKVSDLSGSWVEVPEEVAYLTELSLKAYKDTSGAFDPTIGPIVNLWKIGFGGDKVPDKEQITKALKLVDASGIEIKRESGHTYMKVRKGQFIDLGGIAKGYIGDKIAQKLAQSGCKKAIINLGGNVNVLGSSLSDSDWKIGIRRPDHGKEITYFAIVKAKDESVVTSGAYERFFEKNGKHYGHIISPKDGQPVPVDMASVSLISSNQGAQTDALGTAFFVMGWDATIDFLRKHKEYKVVLLSKDLKKVVITENLRGLVTVTDPKMSLEVLK